MECVFKKYIIIIIIIIILIPMRDDELFIAIGDFGASWVVPSCRCRVSNGETLKIGLGDLLTSIFPNTL